MSVPVFSIEGKVAIVTGSSRGIGKTLALGFAEAGASVVLAARTLSELEANAQGIRTRGGKALVVPTDVTNSSQVSEMVQRALREFGRIDVLVNNAGGPGTAPLTPPLDVSEAIWDELLARNLKSVYLCCLAVGRVMIEQESGSIINISSLAATKAVSGQSAAGAAKAGVNQLTRALAVAWGRFNVRVNAIAPALTLTSRTVAVLEPELIERLSKDIPLRRAGRPDDLLGPAIFLASEASGWITGAVIPVDGGPQ